jgi:hypothetical protein
MNSIKRETEEWIKFYDFMEYIKNPLKEGWITIWKNLNDKRNKQINSAMFATFIKKGFKEKSKEKKEWDFLMLSLDYNLEEIEPILFFRSFYGIRPHFFDISEKFRHYFNLYSKEDKNYYFLDELGEEIKVIDYQKEEIKINVKFLFEYLRDNHLILSLGFDLMRWQDKLLEEYGFDTLSFEDSGEDLNLSFYARNENFISDNSHSFSSIYGKKYISPPKNFNESILNPKEEYENFIIGIEDNGDYKYFTCEEERLGNYFGKNPDAPLFVNPVFFKKEVLDKYYSQPSKYSVTDGYLSCKGLWGIRIDNNVPENVTVFLGDLGRLPNKEQKYWKLYNLSEGTISEPFFKRNFKAEFCSPSNPAEYFKEKVTLFKQKWKDKFGWDLFRDLKEGDEHYWKILRVPIKEQKEFDEMIEALTKVLIESINSEKIKAEGIILDKEKNTGSISHLEEYLKQKHSLNSSEMFTFLRKLQTLRSKGIHFKNEGYNQIYCYFDKGSISKTFEEILVGAIITLNTIEDKILKSVTPL